MGESARGRILNLRSGPTMRRTKVVALGLAAMGLCAGCKSTQKKSTAADGRDPLTMSHLTHGKGDPLYAGSDNEMLVDEDRGPLKAASISRKPESPKPRPPVRTIGFEATAIKSHAADYSWIIGQLERVPGRNGGWQIKYAGPGDDDRYGGRLPFANTPRLGLLREGDTVQVEGNLVETGFDRPSYRVDSIVLRDRDSK